MVERNITEVERCLHQVILDAVKEKVGEDNVKLCLSSIALGRVLWAYGFRYILYHSGYRTRLKNWKFGLCVSGPNQPAMIVPLSHPRSLDIIAEVTKYCGDRELGVMNMCVSCPVWKYLKEGVVTREVL